jgi:hypothetical protein
MEPSVFKKRNSLEIIQAGEEDFRYRWSVLINPPLETGNGAEAIPLDVFRSLEVRQDKPALQCQTGKCGGFHPLITATTVTMAGSFAQLPTTSVGE